MPHIQKKLADLSPGKQYLYRVTPIQFDDPPQLRAAEIATETPTRITFTERTWGRSFFKPDKLHGDNIGRTPEEAVALFKKAATKARETALKALDLAENRITAAENINLNEIRLRIENDWD